MKVTLDLTGKALKKTAWTAAGHWDEDGDLSVSGKKILVGLGKKDKFNPEKIRRAVAKVLLQARVFKIKELVLDLASLGEKIPIEEVASVVVESARASSYRFDKYKSKRPPTVFLSTLILSVKNSKEVAKIHRAVKDAEVISRGVYFTRDLSNEPANVMTPLEVARAAKAMASKHGLLCRVLGKSEIQKLKMGGILGVAQGSSFPPQLIVLENRVRTTGRSPVQRQAPIVLVGKGITFDTGGISIKPSADMDKMKFDMCGAAAVIGAMQAIADLKLSVKVIGIAAVCENMPGSKAQRPGDIIRIMNGKTVEVLNTDAEGRLILADALSYAKQFKPRALVDIATLTGACAATFGDKAIGLMGTDEALMDRFRKAGEKTGERVWQLPLWDEYFDLIRATYADIQNISKKNAGTITAGMFLKEFAGHTKSWAHLDIAGTAWTNHGSTGVGVRLFVEFVKGYLKE